MTNQNTRKIHAGFADPVTGSNATFRALMSATSYPGKIFTFERLITAPAPLNVATMTICLSLMDFDTPLWLDAASAKDEVKANLRFHCAAPLVDDKAQAGFALIADVNQMSKFDEFNAGEIDYPDRSTTLIIQVPSLTQGPAVTWTGPGIKDIKRPMIAGLPDWFWPQWQLNQEIYPQGVDVFFTSDNAIIGMPRTIKVEV